jgi:uncharacterized protein YqeY
MKMRHVSSLLDLVVSLKGYKTSDTIRHHRDTKDFPMSLPLKTRIADEVKSAMRAKNAARLSTLRLLSAAIKQKEVDERRELPDADITAIVEKQVKQRRESIAAFEQAGRLETAAREKAELAVLQEFLPQAASPAEIAAAIDAALAGVAAQGVTGPPAMGRAMAILKPALAGKADMAEVSRLLKARLG